MKKNKSLLLIAALSLLPLAACGGHTHTYGTEWKYDETEHWHVCAEDGEKGDVAKHEFKETKTDPTCTTDGKVVYTCSDCGYSYETVLPALGHTLGNYEPTGIKDGKLTVSQTCETCHEVVTSNDIVVPAKEELDESKILDNSGYSEFFNVKNGTLTSDEDTVYAPYVYDSTANALKSDLASSTYSRYYKYSGLSLYPLQEMTLNFSITLKEGSSYNDKTYFTAYARIDEDYSGYSEDAEISDYAIFNKGESYSYNSYSAYASSYEEADSDGYYREDISITLKPGSYIEFFTYSYASTCYEVSVDNFAIISETIAPTSASDYYAATWNSLGGSAVAPTATFKGDTFSQPKDPTKEGFVFDGWYADENLEKEADFTADSNKMFYAKWIKECTVTVNFNNGTENKVEKVGQGREYVPERPLASTNNNKHFAGWYTKATCDDDSVYEGIVNDDMTLYAKWEDALPYANKTAKGYYTSNYSSGTGYSTYSKYVLTTDYDDNLSYGYDGTYYSPYEGVVSGYDETTGRAVWDEIDDDDNFNFCYKDGVFVLPYYSSYTLEEHADDIMILSTNFNEQQDKTSIISLAINGTEENLEEEHYAANFFSSRNDNGDIEYFFLNNGALYTNVTLKDLSGTDVTNSARSDLRNLFGFSVYDENGQLVDTFGKKSYVDYFGDTDYGFVESNGTYGKFTGTKGDLVLNGCGLASLDGTEYSVTEFNGFVRLKNGTTSYDVTLTGNTYTLSDSEELTVTFESNGGSEVEAVKVLEHESIEEPEEPTKDGKFFCGWYTDSECTNKYVFGSEVTSSTTLYAKWADEITITVKNPAGPNTEDEEIKWGKDLPLDLEDPEIVGYSGFGGYYKDENLTQAVADTDTFASDTTIYCKWTGKYLNDAANYLSDTYSTKISDIKFGADVETAYYKSSSYLYDSTGTSPWIYDSTTDTFTSSNQGESYSICTMAITFSADVTVSFDYTVDSESGYDSFNAVIVSSTGGTCKLTDSGANKSGSASFTVASGETLQLNYRKDSSGDKNSDTATFSNFLIA